MGADWEDDVFMLHRLMLRTGIFHPLLLELQLSLEILKFLFQFLFILAFLGTFKINQNRLFVFNEKILPLYITVLNSQFMQLLQSLLALGKIIQRRMSGVRDQFEEKPNYPAFLVFVVDLCYVAEEFGSNILLLDPFIRSSFVNNGLHLIWTGRELRND